MKKLHSLIAMLLLCTILFTACGGGAGEDAIIYEGTEISMLGVSVPPEEISDGGITLALDDNGNATLTLDGEDYNCEWETSGTRFTLTQGSDEFKGTMEDGVVVIENLLDSGMDITFVNERRSPRDDVSEDEDKDEDEDESENEIADGGPEGTYSLSEMNTMGIKMNYADLEAQELAPMTIEFADDGTVSMSAYGETIEIPFDLDGQTLEMDGVTMEFRIERDNFIISSETDGMEVEMVFTHEDSDAWEEIRDQEPTSPEDFLNGGSDADDSGTDAFYGDFVAPGYGAENTIAVETLTLPSTWYGTITISDYVGPYPHIEGEHEAWAYLANDGTADFFEITVDGIYENGQAVLSYYAEVHNYTFFPIADGTDWIFDTYLTIDDETWYTPQLINGILTATYDYVDEDESFTFVYTLAQVADEGSTSTGTSDVPTEAPTISEGESDNNTDSQVVEPSFTIEELQAINQALKDDMPQDATFATWKANLTYEDILEYTGGVHGQLTEDSDANTQKYVWLSTDGDKQNFFVEFNSSGMSLFGYSAF